MNEPITVVPRVIGAIIAVVLQIALAPNIALFGVVPNFIMAYVLIVSIVCPDQSGPVFAFVLGLLFDLLGTGPVGAMAFLLTGVSFLAKRIFMLVNNDTLFMPLLLAAISTLVIELLYAAFMMAFGAGVSALDAFVFRALPGTVYNFLAALIFYPIVVRFLAQPGSHHRSSGRGARCGCDHRRRALRAQPHEDPLREQREERGTAALDRRRRLERGLRPWQGHLFPPRVRRTGEKRPCQLEEAR